MVLNSEDIELFSTGAVKDFIARTAILSPYIFEKDKEPSWDGHIYIYRNSSKTKANLEGRIPVQVKGKVCDDFSHKQIKYSIDIVDLKNYLSDGGVFYFVVYINKQTFAKKIYYCALPPIKLRSVLIGTDGQTSKTIDFYAFPTDTDEAASIVLNCWHHCQKQANVVDHELISLEELKRNNLLEGITIPIAGCGKVDLPKALLGNDVYLYAKIKGSSLLQPLDIIPTDKMTEEVRQRNVSVNGVVFYSDYRIIRKKDSTIAKFGSCFSMQYSETDGVWNIHFKRTSFVRQMAIDLDFFLSLLKNKGFEIAGEFVPFNISSEELGINTEDYSHDLSVARQCVAVLDALHCKEDIELNTLNDSDRYNLWRLIVAFDKKEYLKGNRKCKKEDIGEVEYITIGKLMFCVFLRWYDEETYSITDFFDMPLIVTYLNDKGEQIQISKYSIFKAQDFLNVSNMRFDLLFPSFKDLNYQDRFNDANLFMLELITAYDISNDTKIDALNTALEFAQWLKNDPESNLPAEITVLNLLQTVKRLRKFTEEEEKDLWDIVTNESYSCSCKLGAYLLLDQMVPAHRMFDELTKKAQEEFMSFPIFRFWKK